MWSSSTCNVVFGFVISVLLFVDGTFAYSCYVCDGSTLPTCANSLAGVVVAPTADGCTCCTKSTTGGVTKRECSTIKCVPIPGIVDVCFSDRCNTGNGLKSRDVVGLVFAASAAVVFSHRRVW